MNCNWQPSFVPQQWSLASPLWVDRPGFIPAWIGPPLLPVLPPPPLLPMIAAAGRLII